MNDAPLVSIGMPVYNGEKTVWHAVNSILNQSWSNWELIIIDDGSTDTTRSILRALTDSRIRIFSDGKNLGIAARLNQAVRLARGPYFARMDADDFSFSHRLSKQVDFLQHHPGIDLVGSSMLVFKNEKEPVGVRMVPASHDRICNSPDQGFKLMHPTWMGRLAWFKKHPYHESARLCEDQELLLRQYQTSCYANIEEPLVGYREDGLNLKKILKTRWFWSRQLVGFWYGLRRQPLYAAGAVIKQVVKGAVDAFAIITGLNYHVLGHRAIPIDDEHAPAVLALQAGMSDVKKRICMATTVHFVIGWFLKPHILRLAEEYDITIVTRCSKQEFADLNLPESVQLKNIYFVREPHLIIDLICFSQLYWFFKKNRFDLIHSIMPKSGLLAMTAARLANLPVRIHTFTGQVWATRTGIYRQSLKMIDRFFASQATAVLTDSHSQRDFLLCEKVIDPARSHVLLNGSICGVNPNRFYPDPEIRRQVREEWLIPEKEVVFLFVGRLKRDKGLLELGAAFSELIRTRKDIHLVIAGTDEESIQTHSLFKQMTQVYFPGYTTTPERYMNAADIFCLPSHREGFGTVILEAACVGIPSVASRIYGITDAVVDGKTGILHTPGNIRELGGCMKILLESPGLRKKMGDAARFRAISDFSEQQVTKALADFYRKYITFPGSLI
jgi:glycosyltransferase involved in cell wall biosynthesis